MNGIVRQTFLLCRHRHVVSAKYHGCCTRDDDQARTVRQMGVEHPPIRRSERGLIATGVVLSLVMVAMSLTPAETRGSRPYDLLAIALLAVAYGSLILCRRQPVTALVLAQVASSVWFPRGYAGALPAPALLVAIFFLTVSGNRRRTILALAFVVAPFTAAAMLSGDVGSLTTAAGVIGWMVAAALLGEAVTNRRALEAEYLRRIETAAAEQHAEMERRIAQERLRIARDMHDVLAHTVTAMSIQAAVASDALELDPDATARALANLRRQARQAVDDVRISIESLRSATEPADRSTDAVPGLGAVAALVDQACRTGLQVTLERPIAGVAIPEFVDVNAYRIVQEALTNIQRHSLANTATVTIDVVDDTLVVRITDPGPRRLPERPAGFGLIGMRERSATSGGELTAEPTSAGGFRVTATLPLHTARR
jgi:signal transduction histidine kinase